MSTWVEEVEETPPQDRIIVTALKSKVQMDGVYEVIERTNQNRALVESVGSSLYTRVLTTLLGQGVELTEVHLNHGLINTCFRACCTTQSEGGGEWRW
jgi:hypothetical protein